MSPRRATASLFITFFLSAVGFFAVLTIVPTTVRATILYVGGTGPGNYTDIWPAINAANPGDTIYVYSGSYSGNFNISKTLSIIGQGKDSTFIIGLGGYVVEVRADWVNLTGFTATTMPAEGIRLWSVHNVTIGNNSAEIILERSSDNMIFNNSGGIGLWQSTGNIVANNLALEPWGPACISLESAAKNRVIGNTIPGGNCGINLQDSSNNTIANNKVYSSISTGIYLNASSDNVVSNNIISSNWQGIHLQDSDSNVVTGNTVSSNAYRGIGVSGSGGNHIIGNTVSNSVRGIDISQTDNNDISGNTVTNNQEGIFLGAGSSNTSLAKNAVIGNGYGITIYRSSEDTVANNTVSWNSQGGIFLGSSWNISVFHNSIMNNSPQAFDDITNTWDNGYPSGGNYWSDYNGIDIYSGPNQNLPGSDGIGDTPYNISGASGKDRYPLMKPEGFSLRLQPGHRFVSFPVEVVNESIQSVLSSISGCYDYVRWYDPLDPLSPWKSHAPGRVINSLVKLNNTMGFWINMTSTCSLALADVRPSSTAISLRHGWNMVGFPSFNTSYMIANLKADLGLGGVVVETFDPSAASYYLQRVSDSYAMKAGEGYWIYVPSDVTWIASG